MNLNSMKILQILCISLCLLPLKSCKKEKIPDPSIVSFSPVAGAVGSSVTITGTGFSSENTVVTFNNATATITNATTTSLLAIVPTGATSGKIRVTVGGNTATSSTDYEVEIELTVAEGSSLNRGYSVALDGSGNTYISGTFEDKPSFAGTVLNSAGSDDIFLAKYDSHYNLVWVKSMGGTYPDGNSAIAVDNTGNVYISGTYSVKANIGNVTLTGAAVDGFVAKFDPSGNILWAKQISSITSDGAYSIKLDATGIPYVTGVFSGTATFGTTSLTSDGDGDIFVAKYNPANGEIIWAKKYGGENLQIGSSLCINSSGEIYLAGNFMTSAKIGTNTFTAAGDLDSFIAKLNSEGEVIWAKQISGPYSDIVASIVTDANGNCYATGYYIESTSFDGLTLTSSGKSDIFLSKFSSSGNLIWVKSAGSNDVDKGNSVAVDNTGNVYITGYFSNNALFGDKTLTTNGINNDLFVAKFNSEGNINWVKQAGGPGFDYGNSIAVNGVGTLTIGGYFRGTGTFTFGVTSYTGKGNDYVFLWRIWQ